MADEGGRGGLDPPFLADKICEQPLTVRARDLKFGDNVHHPLPVTCEVSGGACQVLGVRCH